MLMMIKMMILLGDYKMMN